jgi:hypothetical protein
MLVKEKLLFIMRSIQNTQIYYVGRMQSFNVVQQFEHIEPLSFEGYFNFRTENERGVLK